MAFRRAWNKRLESWAEKAAQSARRLSSRRGADDTEAPSWTWIRHALSELQQCGERAYELEAARTREVLDHVCANEVARTWDRSLYRLRRNDEARR
jgi:hypothetical protein